MDIREKLLTLSDEKYRVFASGLLPEVNGILGVRLPELRKLAKQIVKNDWEIFLAELNKTSFEERMLAGLVVGYVSVAKEDRVTLLRQFIPLIDNWSICDSCCITYKFMLEDAEFWWHFLQGYFRSSKEFEVRFALVCGLDFFIRDEYIDAFLNCMKEFSNDAYYAKMAAAWAISMCYVKYKGKTTEFLYHSKLDDFTYKKSIQKIKESRAITAEEKKGEVQRLWQNRF